MFKLQAGIAAAMVAVSGCAAMQGQTAGDSEQILAEAGFARQAQSAAPGATSAARGSLPARQLTAVSDNGATAYEFYDPQFCRCVYVGGADEYARLQQLRSARLAEHAQLLRVPASLAGSPDPHLWGPYQPEGLDLK
jgi:hypothetical protein